MTPAIASAKEPRFRLSAGPTTPAQAIAAAFEIETCLGEIASGKRKASKLPIQPIAKLVQYVRDEAEAATRFEPETVWCPACEMQFATEKLYMANREIDRLRAQLKTASSPSTAQPDALSSGAKP